MLVSMWGEFTANSSTFSAPQDGISNEIPTLGRIQSHSLSIVFIDNSLKLV